MNNSEKEFSPEGAVVVENLGDPYSLLGVLTKVVKENYSSEFEDAIISWVYKTLEFYGKQLSSQLGMGVWPFSLAFEDGAIVVWSFAVDYNNNSDGQAYKIVVRPDLLEGQVFINSFYMGVVSQQSYS